MLTLVTGGARSGKSRHAEALIADAPQVLYIATSQIFDDEMAERVRLHQERRSPQRWNNYEAPYAAEQVMVEAGKEADAILFDCLTLYMSNLMYGKVAIAGTFEEKVTFVKGEIVKLVYRKR